MDFTFENLGPINSGQVTLAPLTIICGKNNVGKTYISHAIYATLKNYAQNIKFGIITKIFTAHREEKLAPIGTIEIDLLDYVTANPHTGPTNKITISAEKLAEFFNTPTLFENSKVSASNTKDILSKTKSSEFSFNHENETASCIIQKDKNSTKVRISYVSNNGEIEEAGLFLLDLIFQIFEKLNIDINNPRIITSERTGIALYQPTLDRLVANLGHETSILKGKKRSTNITMESIAKAHGFSAAIADNMNVLRTPTKQRSALADNKEIFEELKQLIGGDIFTDGNSVTFRPIDSSTTIPIEIASSSTKSMYLIERYIKNTAEIGDYLIIDEPELNLHIDNQIRMARLIAMLVNTGINVIITTHSDHLLREINALSMLGSGKIDNDDTNDFLQEFGIPPKALLNIDQVNAFVVSSREKRVFPVDKTKYGLNLDLFNQEIMGNNKKLRAIQDALANNQ